MVINPAGFGAGLMNTHIVTYQKPEGLAGWRGQAFHAYTEIAAQACSPGP